MKVFNPQTKKEYDDGVNRSGVGTDMPDTVLVTGEVSITNFPTTQPISGTVSIDSLPSLEIGEIFYDEKYYFDTTDTLIATVAAATSERKFSNSSLSIAMNGTTDYIEIKGVQPTWATNPLTTIYGGYVYLE